LIEVLQKVENIEKDDILKIEWNYLELLDYYHGARPITIEYQLAGDPQYFCQLIQLLYRPKHETKPVEISEEKKSLAGRAWRLFKYWKIPPGLQPNNSFNHIHFKNWMAKVKKEC